MTLSSTSNDLLLFELKEPILLAQGIAEGSDQIHLAYLKATGELCYSIISTTGEHQSTTLGKLDTRTNRYDRLILLPVNKVIHIFYATSHLALPDVWRVTHLFWNGRTWQSAQLGEVVHPRYPLYHVLIDSKSNLHALMMTFLGNRSVLMSSFFNGTFHVWSKRQESLSVPREVVDMTALMTPYNTGYIFWAAKQPGSDKFEVGLATQPKAYDFMSAWQIEPNPAINIAGPWRGLGVIHLDGVLSLLIHADQERLVQFNNRTWNLASSSSSSHSSLYVVLKSESMINYTNWLKADNGSKAPLYAHEIRLPSNIAPSSQEERVETTPDTGTPPDSETTFDSETPSITENTIDEISLVTNQTSEIDPPLESFPPSEALSENLETQEVLVPFLQSLGEKVDLIPEVLESLIRKNEETLEALRLLEDKVNQLKAEREIATKKGFWERWLT